MRAIQLQAPGGPEVLHLVDLPTPEPGPGEIRIRHGAIGLNYADVSLRIGVYPLNGPSLIGSEGAGVVEAVGEGVTTFQVGDRAGYCTGPIGAYAEANVVPAGRAVRIPNGVSDELAAATMMKGMTARYLLKRTYPVGPGVTVLWHAAAGGVGLLATQWARALGATVIGVVGSRAKAEVAAHHGCDHVIVAPEEDIARRARDLTGGEGVDVVYDSVGKDTFEASLDSLRPMGLLVSCGNASGPAPDINARHLLAKGSLFFTRPGLAHYTRTPALLQETADDLFAALIDGLLKVEIRQRWPLEAAAEAHAALQSRQTVGASILTLQ